MHPRREEFAGLFDASVHGVVTARALTEASAGPSVIRRLASEHALTRVATGVYVIGVPSGSWEQALAIDLAAAGPDAMVAGAAAARLWGLDGFVTRPGDQPAAAAVLLNVSRRDGRRGANLRRVRGLEPHALVGDLLLTGINQTLIELGGALPNALSPGGHRLTPEDQVELALESALRGRFTTIERVRDVLVDCGSRREGAAVLRAVLDRRPTGAAATESWMETRCIQVLRNDGFIDVERQVPVYDRRGRLIGRVDLILRRIILECDGQQFHPDFEKDRERWAALQAMGHLVLAITFRQLEFGTTALLRTLRELLAVAA